MDIFTYSEARQKLASVLDRAKSTGKVLIRRKDGSTFALVPETMPNSPLDVPSIKANISTEQITSLVKKERGKSRIRPRLTTTAHSPRFQAMLNKSRQSIKAGKGLSRDEFWKTLKRRRRKRIG
jgi:antitoxin Phd